ncbi:hypothetical protein CALVIDRAFT_535228 [Calocera viscosa TUFC12733]|uniref:Uncharacterized protein n=1 Tax=Calocera viscosa (strain TUFC12733) TaxID=1330018 RepID=A0A167PBA1_CALVF|nr:hypothetical protein CALVIDRAFT_535228 [Calocera viscosa TUFC12733]
MASAAPIALFFSLLWPGIRFRLTGRDKKWEEVELLLQFHRQQLQFLAWKTEPECSKINNLSDLMERSRGAGGG